MITLADQCREGVEAVTDILNGVFRFGLSKALNPLNRRDFLIISGRVARKLRAAAVPEEVALREAINTLDVDWGRLSVAGQEKVIEAARRAQLDSIAKVRPRIKEVFDVEGETIVGDTRTATISRYDLDIEGSFTALDRRIIDFNTNSQANFVTNAMGQRAEAASAKARQIVSDGLRRGLGRKDLARNLEAGLLRSGLNRSRNYFEVVGSSFTNRSRTYSQLSSFTDAEIARFTFEAMLDEATTNVCRFMHGKTFDVRKSLEIVERTEAAESQPEQIKDIQPWVRDGFGDGGKEQIQATVAGEPVKVARVLESAVGQKDKIGRFSESLSVSELEARGITLPPLHGLCRSTVVPDI